MIKDDGVRIVVETVAAMRGLQVEKIPGTDKTPNYARARQEVMWIVHELEITTPTKLGVEFSRKAAAIMNGKEVVRSLMRRNDKYAGEVQRIRDMCLRRLRGDRLGVEHMAVDRFEAVRVARKVLTCTNPHLHTTAPELRGMAAALLGVTETTKPGGQNA